MRLPSRDHEYLLEGKAAAVYQRELLLSTLVKRGANE